MIFRPLRTRTSSLVNSIRTGAATLIFLNTLAVTHVFGAVTVQLNAYDGDGTNTHTVRLQDRVSIVPTVRGTLNLGVTWSLSGAGSLQSGMYYAPATMPSNPNVTVTAKSNADGSVVGSYSFSLINPVPIIRYASGWPLPTASTTTLTVVGQYFEPTTKLYVNGTQVPTTYKSTTQLTAPVWIADNQVGSVQVTAKTPSPGGGGTANLSVPIKALVINLNAFDKTGTNTGMAQLGLPVQFRANVTGSPLLSKVWPVTWSIASGAGSINAAGTYFAPASLPSSNQVTVKAALVANPQVYATYQLTIMNPTPVVNNVSPTHVKAGTTSTVTLIGSGFVPNSKVWVNGQVVASTYKANHALAATVSVGSSATHALITVQNPDPGGSTSQAYSLQVSGSSTASATIGTDKGRYIQSNFIGFSHEWGDAQWFMGTQQNGANTVYRQLVTNLINPGDRPFMIRVGGGTTDTTGYPDTDTVQALAELANALPVHFTLGVNLGSNDPSLAQDQAYTYLKKMPANTVDAIEIGNEPDNYVKLGLRPSGYNMNDYLSDFNKWRGAILQAVPSSTKFMGPAWGSMLTLHNNMAAFNAHELSSVPIFSQHAYGEYTGSQSYSNDYLLSDTAATTGPQAVADYAQASHRHGQIFRIGEINSVDNGGVDGISNSFASALWALDTMFEYANVGVDGVNWHGTSGCSYCAFTFNFMNVYGRTVYSLAKINPLYYSLVLFHMATGNTARMLPVDLDTGANIKTWAMVDQNNVVHVVIINKDKSFAGNMSITLPGHGDAEMIRLTAPSYESTSGISLGGRTFDGSVDGKLVGGEIEQTVTPDSNGVYNVTMQPTSVVMLTMH